MNVSNYHLSFAQAVVGKTFDRQTTTYLNKKFVFFQQETSGSHSEGESISRHIAHVLKLPATLLGLTIQTATDAALVALIGLGHVFTFGLHEKLRDELSARTYNLLVADTLTWLSILPSVFCYTAYTGANSLHLGTTRDISLFDPPPSNLPQNDRPPAYSA